MSRPNPPRPVRRAARPALRAALSPVVAIARRRPARLALASVLLICAAAGAPRSELELQGIHCPPTLWLHQATEFSHFSATVPEGDAPPLIDCNDVFCRAWLKTVDIPIAGGCIHGRPLPGRQVTIYAVREDGQTEKTVVALTDAHGMATALFDDLPVSGSVDHDHCAQTPSGTWECYEFYAAYHGSPARQEYGGCVVETSCESVHKHMLLEDSEVIPDCGGIPGCVERWGGVISQLDLTLTISAETLDEPLLVTIDRPPAPPPAGIPPGAAIVDWRRVGTENTTLYPPAVAALDYSESTLQGYGNLGTMIYRHQPGSGGWAPLPAPPDRSAVGRQIRWPLQWEGFYALVAFEDTDLDGIEDVLEESTFMTDRYVPDSDLDGLPDGFEQMLACTLPALADTDADGFSDGIEVAEGTDPNDPRDYPGAVDRGDHAIGELQTTVTDKGIFGFTDLASLDGLGFVYPAGGANLLYVGGLWAGTGADYVVNRDYAADSADWEVAAHPDGHIVFSSSAEVEQILRSAYNDSPHPLAKWLRVEQETSAWSTPPDDALVLERFELRSEGLEPVAGLFVGQFLDFDITAETATSNLGTTDPQRNLIYMWRAESALYAGVMLIEPATAANLTFIHNPTFVWPNQRVLDADKFAFLSAADPQHSVPEAPAPADWSVLVSAGPLEVSIEETTAVGFALVAGASPAELIAHADRARARYHSLYGGGMSAEGMGRAAAPPRTTASPNPFVDRTTIRCLLPSGAPARLGVYDAAGRLVRRLTEDPARLPGERIWIWDARDDLGRRAPAGLYHYRWGAGDREGTGRLMLLR
ncbi:MAG: hypothetical protein FJY75_05420 [Candidatus Eisenbacteria bacterium]|uniref:FlgD Ig-like domain-containing protein n=1 Tax=Eiseniibacteriota bacterium TaxID=2212470 RepID=A0A937XAI6_UNCEI|nr:hypothetical protein [Candidatus Eisenbacteria bacterium]